MILTSDILYILLDYCDPTDTNILSVIETLTENENVFNKFIKFSVQKTHRIKIGKENHKHIIKKERQNQFKQFQIMKKKNNYKLLDNYNIVYDIDNKTDDKNHAPFHCDKLK